MVKFYCTHYTKLENRKPILVEAFNTNGIQVEWIEDEPTLDCPRHITKNQQSSIHKHYVALTRFIEQDECDLAVVFEDDVMIDNNFNQYFNQVLKEIDGLKFDFISLGNVSIFDNNPEYAVMAPTLNQLVYIGDWKTTACAHAMLFTKDFAKKCVEKFNYQDPFDIYINWIIRNTGAIVGRTFPYLKQRTIDGDWASAIPTDCNGYSSWYGGKK